MPWDTHLQRRHDIQQRYASSLPQSPRDRLIPEAHLVPTLYGVCGSAGARAWSGSVVADGILPIARYFVREGVENISGSSGNRVGRQVGNPVLEVGGGRVRRGGP